MRRATIAVLALSLLVAAPAFGRPSSLLNAVQKVYAPKKVHLDVVCFKGYRGHGYALVGVSIEPIANKSQSAYQYFKSRGWVGMWRNGKVMKRVAKSQRARVRAAVKYMKFACP